MKDIYEPLELHKVKEQMEHFCAFSLGKQMLRQASPHFEALWVQRELQRVKEALLLVVRYGSMPFTGLHDTSQAIMAAMKDMTIQAAELRRIADGIRACAHVQAYLRSCEQEVPAIRELTDSFSEQRKLAEQIERCISVSFEVVDAASDELRQVRKAIRGCEQDIGKAVQQVIARYGSKLMDTITTRRNDRICVLVKISEKNSIDGFVHGESASGQTAYVEPQSLLLLNNRLQSLRSQEQEIIERILHDLSQAVKASGYELLGNLDTFALLDGIFAKAQWAKAMDGCVAELQPQGDTLYIHGARHPLIAKDKVVANTYRLQPPQHMLLITGSNTGGKTVTLKTIGLFVAMTMCGMPISAEAAILPQFDALYIDIGDEQSIQASLSTFSSHISKMAEICQSADSHALVLLDELGSGTDPREGEMLAVAMLEHLRRKRATVIATTHYSALKSYGAAHEEVLVSCVEFDVEKLCPTYRYIEGMSGQSYAFEIAERYGMREDIIQAARQYRKDAQTHADEALEKLEQESMAYHERREQLEARLADIKKLQEQLEKEQQHLQRDKERILEQVRQKAQEQLEATQAEADAVLDTLKKLQSDAKPHEITELKRQLHALTIEEAQTDTDREESFVVGDYVRLKKLNYYGEILSLQKDKVCVYANHMKMNTTIKDITHAERPQQKKQSSSGGSRRITHFSMECNVIGMRVAEALAVIDKYLDNAILAKVYQVRIIHGMGTGRLRKGVHDYLKHHAQVESFMMGGQGEGGLGATIVKLKQKKK